MYDKNIVQENGQENFKRTNYNWGINNCTNNNINCSIVSLCFSLLSRLGDCEKHSATYIDGEQNGNGGCFVITPLIVKDEDKISTKVSADFGSKSNANFLNKIISRKSKDEIKIQKVMNRELLYAIRAMEDGFGRKW